MLSQFVFLQLALPFLLTSPTSISSFGPHPSFLGDHTYDSLCKLVERRGGAYTTVCNKAEDVFLLVWRSLNDHVNARKLPTLLLYAAMGAHLCLHLGVRCSCSCRAASRLLSLEARLRWPGELG